jgi:hypothetical protein
MFMCPEDPNAGKNSTTTSGDGLSWAGPLPPEQSQGFHGNYVVCSGSSTFGDVAVNWGPVDPNNPRNGSFGNGMFRAVLQPRINAHGRGEDHRPQPLRLRPPV